MANKKKTIFNNFGVSIFSSKLISYNFTTTTTTTTTTTSGAARTATKINVCQKRTH